MGLLPPCILLKLSSAHLGSDVNRFITNDRLGVTFTAGSGGAAGAEKEK